MKNAKLIAFHPGTIDSLLSKSFQASVLEGKLFDVDFVVGQLVRITRCQPFDQSVS